MAAHAANHYDLAVVDLVLWVGSETLHIFIHMCNTGSESLSGGSHLEHGPDGQLDAVV